MLIMLFEIVSIHNSTHCELTRHYVVYYENNTHLKLEYPS